MISSSKRFMASVPLGVALVGPAAADPYTGGSPTSAPSGSAQAAQLPPAVPILIPSDRTASDCGRGNENIYLLDGCNTTDPLGSSGGIYATPPTIPPGVMHGPGSSPNITVNGESAPVGIPHRSVLDDLREPEGAGGHDNDGQEGEALPAHPSGTPG